MVNLMVNESTIGVSIKIVIWDFGEFLVLYCDFVSVHKYGSGYDYILGFLLEFSYAPRILIYMRA